MSTRSLIFLLALLVSLCSVIIGRAQESKKDVYIFTIEKQVKATPVKNQFSTGTCWSFAACSFLESEILRLGKEEFDLSEMFPVRCLYPQKAVNYVRYHGKTTFGEGGQAHDFFYAVKGFGMVPEDIFKGNNYGDKKRNHEELDLSLKGLLDGVIKNSRLTSVWSESVNSILDSYLGKTPANFTYKSKSYNPKSFVTDALGINPDNYIEITSYTHHPFYSAIVLEVPDNWSKGESYNVPIADLITIMDNALKNGYSVTWDGDISEPEFSGLLGIAIVPAKDWSDKTKDERDSLFMTIEKEKEITQELRQVTFDNYTTTDDHLMHIVGMAKDQNGTKYYYTKNSWGTTSKYNGYMYLSEAYIKLKTIAILINKESIPTEIRSKLGLK